MIPITKQQEKDIYRCYKHGLAKQMIKRMFNITDRELLMIVRTAIRREDNQKDKLKK